jgi:hypothetical protein
MKQNLRDEGVEVKDGQPIHHLETIESAGKAPLIKGAVELEGHNINQGRNLRQLPKDSESRKLWPEGERDLLPEHGPDNYHPKWREHAIEVSNKKLELLRKECAVPEHLTPEEAVMMIHEKYPGVLKKASEELLPTLKNDLLVPEADWIRLNENGERILALNQPTNEKEDKDKNSDEIVLNA